MNLYRAKDLRPIIDLLPSGITMVELGSFCGISMEVFIRSEKIKIFYTVDKWEVHDEIESPKLITNFMVDGIFFKDWQEVETMWDKMAESLKSIAQIYKIKNDSAQTSSQFTDKSIDFVYIDANHDPDKVTLDITSWLPKIKLGGYIGGHDYRIIKDNGQNIIGTVVGVVDNIFGKPDYVFGSNWMVLKK